MNSALLAELQTLLADLVTDQDDTLPPEARERAAAQALLRYRTDLGLLSDAPVPQAHLMPVAQWAAYLLCQQLATRYSGERETTLAVDMARTQSRAQAYAARAKEYRQAYYAGTGQADPLNPSATPSQGAAAAVTSWPRRNPRHNLVRRGAGI